MLLVIPLVCDQIPAKLLIIFLKLSFVLSAYWQTLC